MIDGPSLCWDQLIALQQAQMELIVAMESHWSRALRDAWDLWICRWGGGVPIDV